MNGDRCLRLPPHLQGAKIAFGELVDAFGGQVAAAAETGKSQPRISSYSGRNLPDFPPLDVIDALEARTVGSPGHPQVTAWLVRRRGYELVKLPDPAAPAISMTALAAELVQTGADLAAGILGALDAGGKLSAANAWRLQRLADEMVRIAVETRAALKARASDDDGGA